MAQAQIRVRVARFEDKPILRQLLEFNAYEFSRFTGADLDEHGQSATATSTITGPNQAASRISGRWAVHEISGNDATVRFWRQAIPQPYTEEQDEHGTTQWFTMPRP